MSRFFQPGITSGSRPSPAALAADPLTRIVVLFVLVALAVFGLFMVGSASNYEAMTSLESASGYLIKHLIFLFAGFAALFAALSFPYQKLSNRALVLGSWDQTLFDPAPRADKRDCRRWTEVVAHRRGDDESGVQVTRGPTAGKHDLVSVSCHINSNAAKR